MMAINRYDLLISANKGGLRIAWDADKVPCWDLGKRITFSVLAFNREMLQILVVAGAAVPTDRGARCTITKSGTTLEEVNRLQVTRAQNNLKTQSLLVDYEEELFFSPVVPETVVPVTELVGNELTDVSHLLDNSMGDAWLITCRKFLARTEGIQAPRKPKDQEVLTEADEDVFQRARLAPGVREKANRAFSGFDAYRDREEISDAVRIINAAKDQLGENLSLKIGDDGKLSGEIVTKL